MPYETITVGEGEHRTITVGHGDTFENVLIDISRDGASATLKAIESGWTIRNVGFQGMHENPEGPVLDLADRSGQDSVVDYVHLGDGSDGGRGTGARVNHNHNGHILMARCRAEGFGDRAFDSSRPAMGGAGGTVRYSQCRGAGSWGAQFQTGNDELDRCVATETGRYEGRGLWAYGDTSCHECDFVTNGKHYAVHAGLPGKDVTVTLEDTRYEDTFEGGLHTASGSTITETNTSTTPDDSVGDVPTDAVDAAEGSPEPITINPPSSDNYETITAPFSYTVSSGETFENKIIDFGNGNDVTITAKGSNWTIRNIGFKGSIPVELHSAIFGVADSGGGTSTMENIYIGESSINQPSGSRTNCIWVDPSHSGTLNFENIHFNVPGNNGIYGSAPGSNGNGQRGDININGCYANDCHHTAYRISDNGDSITNSVVYKSGSRTASRGIWVWNGPGSPATLENVDVITNGAGAGVVDSSPKGTPTINMTDVCTDDGTGTGCSPNDYLPDGCPENAEQAASGSGPSAPSPDPPPSDGGGEEDLPTDWVQTSPATGSEPGDFQAEITGLDTNATYEYRAVAEIDGAPESDGGVEAFVAERGAGNIPDYGEDGDGGLPRTDPVDDPYPDNAGRNETVVVEIEPGDHWTPHVSDGETFENVIIDLTNNNTAATITASGSDWTIRNIAFAGSQDLAFSEPCYSIMVEADSGATGTIDHVWLGDGSHVGRDECGTYGRGAVYVTDNNQGTIRVQNSTIAWFPGAGVHGYRGTGEVHVENCYLENNGYSYIALGNEGSSVNGCVVNHRLGGGQ